MLFAPPTVNALLDWGTAKRKNDANAEVSFIVSVFDGYYFGSVDMR